MNPLTKYRMSRPNLLMWDREDKQQVLQDGRAFVSGLSDDAGGAAALGLAAKSMFAPAAEELARSTAESQAEALKFL